MTEVVEIKPQTKLMGKGIKIIELKIDVEPLVLVQVEIINL
jgi:hypothetical protein